MTTGGGWIERSAHDGYFYPQALAVVDNRYVHLFDDLFWGHIVWDSEADAWESRSDDEPSVMSLDDWQLNGSAVHYSSGVKLAQSSGQSGSLIRKTTRSGLPLLLRVIKALPQADGWVEFGILDADQPTTSIGPRGMEGVSGFWGIRLSSTDSTIMGVADGVAVDPISSPYVRGFSNSWLLSLEEEGPSLVIRAYLNGPSSPPRGEWVVAKPLFASWRICIAGYAATSGTGIDTWDSPSVRILDAAAPPLASLYGGWAYDDSGLYVAGGTDRRFAHPDRVRSEVFHWDHSEWSLLTHLPEGRNGCAVSLIDGKLYVFGGYDPFDGDVQDNCWEWDPGTDTWTTKSPMPVGLSDASYATIGKKVYLFGGWLGEDWDDNSTLWEWDQATDIWAQRATLALEENSSYVPYDGQGLFAIEGKIFLVWDDGRAFWWNPAEDAWTEAFDGPGVLDSRPGVVINDRLFAFDSKSAYELAIPGFGPKAPNEIAGLAYWLNAADLALADGATVATWTDRINGVTLQAFPAFYNYGLPKFAAVGIGGHPAVRFSGVEGLRREAGYDIPAAVTTVVVARVAVDPGGYWFFVDAGMYLGDGHRERDVYYFGGARSSRLSSDSLADGVAHVWIGQVGSRGMIDILDGGVAKYVDRRPPFKEGERSLYGLEFRAYEGQPATVDVAEVFYYDRELSAGELNDLLAHLSNKYGTPVASLPASGPIAPEFPSYETAIPSDLPSEVPADGLRLWLRAEDLILADGAEVEQWAPHVGRPVFESETPPTFAAHGTNGLPAVRFDGESSYFWSTTDDLAPTQSTLILVGSIFRLDDWGVLVEYHYTYLYASPEEGAEGGGRAIVEYGWAEASTAVPERPSVWVGRATATDNSLHRSGELVARHETDSYAGDPAILLTHPWIGGYGPGPGEGYVGFMLSELLIWERPLSDVELADITDALMAKYDIRRPSSFDNPTILQGGGGVEVGQDEGVTWFHLTASDPGVIDLSAVGDAEALIEVLTPDLELLASGRGSISHVVTVGAAVYVKVAPSVNPIVTLQWLFTVRVAELQLEPIVDTIPHSPGVLRVNVGNGQPGENLEVFVNGVSVLSQPLSEAGRAVGLSVPVPPLAPGTHLLRVQTASGMATIPFTVQGLPPERPDAGGGDRPPPTIVPTTRWTLENPATGTTFAFPINPAKMGSPHGPRPFTVRTTTAPSGQPLTFEGAPKPAEWTFEGTILTQEFYEALESWFALNQRVYLSDHLDRIWVVSLESFEPEPRRIPGNDWSFTYSARVLIYAGPVVAVVRT